MEPLQYCNTSATSILVFIKTTFTLITKVRFIQ